MVLDLGFEVQLNGHMWLKAFMTVEGPWQYDSGVKIHEREVNIFCFIAAVTIFILSQLWRNHVVFLFLHLRLKMILLSMSTLMSPYVGDRKG